MSKHQTYRILEYTTDDKRFRIEEDLPEVGWYLYIFDKSDNCIADYLQDDLDCIIDFASDEYQVSKNNWIDITRREKIQEETNRLLAQRVLSHFDSVKLVDWAIMLMENGFDSESLIILAGLDNESTEERERYFWQTISELQIDFNRTDFELIDDYAVYIAESVITNKIEPRDGLKVMQDIVRSTDYSNKYMPFYEIDEDLDYLKYDNQTIFNTGLTISNADSFIKREFELFLDAEKYKVDDRIRELAYCKNCDKIEKPIFKVKRNWIGKVKYQMWICSLCGSRDILHFSSQKGREMIINRINAT